MDHTTLSGLFQIKLQIEHLFQSWSKNEKNGPVIVCGRWLGKDFITVSKYCGL